MFGKNSFLIRRISQNRISFVELLKVKQPKLQSPQYNRKIHMLRDIISNNKNKKYIQLTALGGCVLSIVYLRKLYNEVETKKLTNEIQQQSTATEQHPNNVLRKDLPTYSEDEIRKHDSKENKIWVTYGLGVYDITNFVPQHPGSNKIMIAAGGALEPFWQIYQQHNTQEIRDLLESFRVGNMNLEEVEDANKNNKEIWDAWAFEPKRHPILKAASQKPFNAEPPPYVLPESFVTPVDFFYVRNHLPVPDIDENTYELEIEIYDEGNSKTLKLKDIKKYPKHKITAAIMCGGNRRSEMTQIKSVRGLFWGQAAVGNAEWSGALLSDVLKDNNVKFNETDHVQFEGLDVDPTNTPYGASIPLSKALDPRGDVLLAYEMNGAPLNRDHGYPLRVIVPGVVGARNVKWLGRIIVSKDESTSHWQQNDYKGFSPSTDWDTVDFSKSPAIQHMPVTSAICQPSVGDDVKAQDGYITVRGYAWSGGGNKIIRVDVTGDKGKTWQVAELEQEDDKNAAAGRHWAWTLWTAKIPVSSVNQKSKEIELWAKAVDANYNVQPETFANNWNLRGVLCNAYHRVKVNIQN